ncbi:MAG: DMT family transporter [Rhodobacterales bacterium]|nr:MAG: DMT family transporter [Rhodobacterales bacterium]
MASDRSRALRAIGLKLASVVLFVAMHSFIKATADHIPPGEAVFFRSAFAIPVILAWVAVSGQLALGLWPMHPIGHFWRGLMGTVSMGLGFAGLAYLPLPEVTAIGFAAPLLTVIFAAIFLDERVPKLNWIAVLLGLCGVCIVLYPRLTILDRAAADYSELFGVFMILGCAVFAALAQTVVRKLLVTDRTPIIVLWFLITATVLSLVTIPFGWVVPSGRDLVFLIASGLTGAVGQILMTESYRYAGASTVSPLDYFSLLLALLIGYFVFGEAPGEWLLFGAPLIVLAGVAVALGTDRKGPD